MFWHLLCSSTISCLWSWFRGFITAKLATLRPRATFRELKPKQYDQWTYPQGWTTWVLLSKEGPCGLEDVLEVSIHTPVQNELVASDVRRTWILIPVHAGTFRSTKSVMGKPDGIRIQCLGYLCKGLAPLFKIGRRVCHKITPITPYFCPWKGFSPFPGPEKGLNEVQMGWIFLRTAIFEFS